MEERGRRTSKTRAREENIALVDKVRTRGHERAYRHLIKSHFEQKLERSQLHLVGFTASDNLSHISFFFTCHPCGAQAQVPLLYALPRPSLLPGHHHSTGWPLQPWCVQKLQTENCKMKFFSITLQIHLVDRTFSVRESFSASVRTHVWH